MRNLVYYYPELNRLLKNGNDVVLCTVIRTEGSAPQVPGARMIVTLAGIAAGTVGGGCGEDRIKSESLRLLQSRMKFKLVEISLRDDLNQKDGDVCGGHMTVLLEYYPGRA